MWELIYKSDTSVCSVIDLGRVYPGELGMGGNIMTLNMPQLMVDEGLAVGIGLPLEL